MSEPTIEQCLVSTLADQKLSRAEQKALRSVLLERGPTVQRLGEFRAIAFRLVRERIRDGDTLRLLAWLEEIVRLTARAPATSPDPISTAYFSPGDDCRNALVREMVAARKTIDVCVFTITDDRISDALLEAHRRGVKVRIITDDDKALDSGSDAERLAAAGILVRMDESVHHMHHKYAVFDGERLVNGSFNFTRSASANNQENLVVTSDTALVLAFARHFADVWERYPAYPG